MLLKERRLGGHSLPLIWSWGEVGCLKLCWGDGWCNRQEEKKRRKLKSECLSGREIVKEDVG